MFGLGFEEGGGGLRCGCPVAGGVVEGIHLIVKLLIDNYLIVNMSALGAWNSRYEGGPCYAACMETFVLYVCNHSATTPRSQFAGRAATTPMGESMMMRAGTGPGRCANVSQRNRWVRNSGSWSRSRI